MTTIAVSLDHKMIAADTLVAGEGNISSLVGKLRLLESGEVIGAAGHLKLILRYLNGQPLSKTDDGEEDIKDPEYLEAIHATPTEIKVFDTNTCELFTIRNRYFACGSGAAYAMGAMAHGATPLEAVLIASKFDPQTNDIVDVMPLKRRRANDKQ